MITLIISIIIIKIYLIIKSVRNRKLYGSNIEHRFKYSRLIYYEVYT